MERLRQACKDSNKGIEARADDMGGWLDLGAVLCHHEENKVPPKFRGNPIEFRGSEPIESRRGPVVMT